MDISFTCEKCGQPLAIDEAGAGAIIDCPKCAASITVPSKPSTKSGEKRLIIKPTAPPKPLPQELIANPTTVRQSRKTCPSCGSEDVIKASAAHEQGTSVIAGKSQQLGAMLIRDSDGGLDVAPGVSGGRFSGVQQTTLAKRFSPPESPKKKNGGVILALGGVITLVSLPLFIVDDIRIFAVLLLVVGVVSMLIGAANLQDKEKDAWAMQQYRTNLEVWQKTWYCKTCGSAFRI